MRTLLANRPFALRLQQRESGGYQAGLQVQLELNGDREAWQTVLQVVAERMQSTGFERLSSIALTATGEDPRFWGRRDDDDRDLVGGWQWLREGESNVLSIGFGIEPANDAFLSRGVDGDAALTVEVWPESLKQLNLLGGRWPQPVERASVLRFRLQPLQSQQTQKTWWRMNGELQLAPQP